MRIDPYRWRLSSSTPAHLFTATTQQHHRGSSSLARAGDPLDDAFAFLEKLGYAGFELVPGGELVPVAARRDDDFWFIPREDCAA